MENQTSSCLTFGYWEALSEASVSRRFWIFAALVFAVRLLVILVVPIDLSGDEAYYWEWSRHLDWGYLSKPPGIAWLMALASKVGGDTVFGIRLFSAVLGTGSLVCLFHLARRLYGPAVAMIAAITFVANPASAALNLLLTIDAPLLFFWTLSLWAFWEFSSVGLTAEKGGMPAESLRKARCKWGLLLFLGLAGGLLSKQMMLAFIPLAVLFLALSKERRRQLRQPSLWLILLGSLTAWLPMLWWNLRNGWLTFHHTMHHFQTGDVPWGRQVARFFEYFGSQCGIVTPVIFLLLIGLVSVAPWRWGKWEDPERFLWIFGGPALLILLLMGLRQSVQPNWPAVFYVSTSILLVGWAAGKWSSAPKVDRWRRAFAPGLIMAGGMTALTYGAVFALSFGLVRLHGLDPTARLRGWSQLARDVDAARRALPGGRTMQVITQGHRFLTSELAFYLPDHPRVYVYNSDPKTIRFQHDLWETPAAHLGGDALVVFQGNPQGISPELTMRFESLTVHSVLRYPQQDAPLRVITLAIGRNLQRWPSSSDRAPGEESK